MPSKSETYDQVYGEGVYEEQHNLTTSLRNRFMKHEVNRYEACLRLLPPKVERLLDVGCGGGHLAKMAVRRASEYHGVDLSPVLLKQAESNLAGLSGFKKTSLTQCDLDDKLPFDSDSFDAVTCIAVLEHVVNPPYAIEEISRVLRTGGVLVVEVPNIAWLPLRARLFFGWLPVTGGVYLGADWEHLHIFTKQLLTDLLTTKGFQVEEVSCSGVFANYRKWWTSLLGGDIIVLSRKGT